MHQQIENVRKTRIFLLDGLSGLTTEQYNKIPEGFNNNIIWNLGHLVAAQQGICYIRAGLTPRVNEDIIGSFKSGTRPGRSFDESEINGIKSLLATMLDQLEQDFNASMFGGYTPWRTRYGIELTCIDDAINFLPYHEGLHSGCVQH